MAKPEAPLMGAVMDRWHRYFWRDETGEYGPLTSVTTVLDTIPKPAIARAATRETARYVLDNFEVIESHVAAGEFDRAEHEISRAVWNEWRASAEFGNAAHDAIRQWVESGGQFWPEGVHEREFISAYIDFLNEEGVRQEDFHGVEQRVFNLTHLFAGTFDQDLTLRGKRTLLDVKTGNDTYDETILQLAGYSLGEFVGREGDPTRYPMPPWEHYAVLHVRPPQYEGGHEAGYRLNLHDITPGDRETFIHAVYVRRWALRKEAEYRKRQKEAV